MKSISDNATDDVEIYLIANKCDLGNLVDYSNNQSVNPPQRQVSRHEGETLASIYGLKYVETSAKSNINIDRAFMEITRDIKLKLDRRIENASDSMYRTYSELSLNNRNSINLASIRRNEFKKKSELNFAKIKKLNRQSLLACFKF
jgi:GTPase SAR1 family protein